MKRVYHLLSTVLVLLFNAYSSVFLILLLNNKGSHFSRIQYNFLTRGSHSEFCMTENQFVS